MLEANEAVVVARFATALAESVYDGVSAVRSVQYGSSTCTVFALWSIVVVAVVEASKNANVSTRFSYETDWIASAALIRVPVTVFPSSEATGSPVERIVSRTLVVESEGL